LDQRWKTNAIEAGVALLSFGAGEVAQTVVFSLYIIVITAAKGCIGRSQSIDPSSSQQKRGDVAYLGHPSGALESP
jgi:hypothetical protein